MFNVANDYQKFPLLSYDLENVLTKHFPKMQKLPLTDVLQNRCSKFIRLKICNFIKKETATYVFSGAQPLGGTGGHSPLPLPLQFWNQTRSNCLSFKYQGYCFLCVFRNYADEKFQNFYRACCKFWKTYSIFSFFPTTQGKQITSRWTF